MEAMEAICHMLFSCCAFCGGEGPPVLQSLLRSGFIRSAPDLTQASDLAARLARPSNPRVTASQELWDSTLHKRCCGDGHQPILLA
jgi:hypothetical protein